MNNSIQKIIEDKETIKKLEFILHMALDSYQRQRIEGCQYYIIEQLCITEQSRKIQEMQEIINTLKEYHEQKKTLA